MSICWKYAIIKTYYFSLHLYVVYAALDGAINAFKMHIHKHSQHEIEQTQNKNRLVRKILYTYVFIALIFLYLYATINNADPNPVSIA